MEAIHSWDSFPQEALQSLISMFIKNLVFIHILGLLSIWNCVVLIQLFFIIYIYIHVCVDVSLKNIM